MGKKDRIWFLGKPENVATIIVIYKKKKKKKQVQKPSIRFLA